MSHLSVCSIFWKSFSCCFFQFKMRYLVMSKKKNPLFVCGWDRKIRPSWTPIVITQQASWCQTVILGTDISTLPSHSWWILIVFFCELCFRFVFWFFCFVNFGFLFAALLFVTLKKSFSYCSAIDVSDDEGSFWTYGLGWVGACYNACIALSKAPSLIFPLYSLFVHSYEVRNSKDQESIQSSSTPVQRYQMGQ